MKITISISIVILFSIWLQYFSPFNGSIPALSSNEPATLLIKKEYKKITSASFEKIKPNLATTQNEHKTTNDHSSLETNLEDAIAIITQARISGIWNEESATETSQLYSSMSMKERSVWTKDFIQSLASGEIILEHPRFLIF